MGRRISAVYHYGGIPGHWESRLCSNLPDRRSRRLFLALPVPDAGDEAEQDLGGGVGNSIIGI